MLLIIAVRLLWCSAVFIVEEINVCGSAVNLVWLGVEQVGILRQGCGEGVVRRFQLLRFILFR